MITSPVSLAVAAAAVGVGGLAAWFHVRRPPALDGERWFKVALATLLRGRVEASGGDRGAWQSALHAFVPYHPAGREPERKVAHPLTYRPPSAWLDGEQALVEALSRIEGADARWAWLQHDAPAASDAIGADPALLGERMSPASWLGVDWDAVAAWPGGDPRVVDAIVQRLDARWLLLRQPSEAPDVLGEIERLGLPTERLELADDELEARVAAVVAWFEQLATSWRERFVVVAEGDAAPVLLRALAVAPGARDLVLAVVFVGGNLRGRPGDDGPLGEMAQRDWLDLHLSHVDLDTERLRLTSYFHLQWVDTERDPPGLSHLPASAQRLPEPRLDSGIGRFLEVCDLGALPPCADLPVDLVARALVLVSACWVLSRR